MVKEVIYEYIDSKYKEMFEYIEKSKEAGKRRKEGFKYFMRSTEHILEKLYNLDIFKTIVDEIEVKEITREDSKYTGMEIYCMDNTLYYSEQFKKYSKNEKVELILGNMVGGMLRGIPNHREVHLNRHEIDKIIMMYNMGLVATCYDIKANGLVELVDKIKKHTYNFNYVETKAQLLTDKYVVGGAEGKLEYFKIQKSYGKGNVITRVIETTGKNKGTTHEYIHVKSSFRDKYGIDVYAETYK